jgi:hypothetical protein
MILLGTGPVFEITFNEGPLGMDLATNIIVSQIDEYSQAANHPRLAVGGE